MGIHELIKTKEARNFTSFIGQFSFVLCNFAIYLVLKNYISVDFHKYYLFWIFSIISAFMIGFSKHPSGYLWSIGLFSLALTTESSQKTLIIAGLIIYPIVIFGKNYMEYISFFSEKVPQITGIRDAFRKAVLFIYVFPRMIFFNSAYNLFPIFFVWLIAIGTMFYYRIFNLKINPSSATDFSFIEIITITGIIFGFFQFYLNRYSEIVQKKTTTSFSLMIAEIENLTFNDFAIFVKGKNKNNQNSISKAIDEYIASHIQTVRPTIKERAYKLSSPEFSTKDFVDFEQYLWENGGDFDTLGEYYQSFFNSKIEEIIKEKSNEASEFMWLLSGNISILTESLPSMFSFDSKKDKKLRTFRECLNNAKLDFINKLFDKWISGSI